MRADSLNPTPGGLARAARSGLAVLLLGIAPAAACLIIGIGLFTHSLGHAPLFDFHGGDWFAARRILAGRTPYELDYLRHRADLIAAGGHPNPNIAVPAYPAPALLLMVPFGLMSYTAAAVVFLLLATAAAAGSLWVLGVRDWRCYGALFLSYPVLHGLALGALTSTLMLLTALAWRYRDRAAVVGSCVAAAIVLKLFLWPLLAWLLITRRTRAAVIAVGGSAAGCLAGWAVLGFTGLASYPEMLSLLSRTQERATYSVASLLAALGAASAPAQAAGRRARRRTDGRRLARPPGRRRLSRWCSRSAWRRPSPPPRSCGRTTSHCSTCRSRSPLPGCASSGSHPPCCGRPPTRPRRPGRSWSTWSPRRPSPPGWSSPSHSGQHGAARMTAVTATEKWRNLGRAAGTGALLLAAAGLAVLSLVTGFGDHNYADFHIFWRAGNDVLNGRTPYPHPAASELRGQNQFVYPAPAAVAMAPFALLSLPASATVFLVLSIACVGASLWIAGVRDIRCFALAAGSLPVIQGVVMGTVTPILMLLLAIAWAQARQHPLDRRYRGSRRGHQGVRPSTRDLAGRDATAARDSRPPWLHRLSCWSPAGWWSASTPRPATRTCCHR